MKKWSRWMWWGDFCAWRLFVSEEHPGCAMWCIGKLRIAANKKTANLS